MPHITRMFDSHEHAQEAVLALEFAGFDRADIAYLVGPQAAEEEDQRALLGAAEGAAEGALTGGLLGTLAGLAAGASALVIPGIGPVLAAGPLLSAFGGGALGAIAGGVTGAIHDFGVAPEEGRLFRDHLDRGGVVVIVHSSRDRASDAAAILDHHQPATGVPISSA